MFEFANTAQNSVYQIIFLIQNSVRQSSFSQLRFLHHKFLVDQIHIHHSLHSRRQLIMMYHLLLSQNADSRFSKTISILSSITSLLRSQSMMLKLNMRILSSEYENEIISQFYAYLLRYLKTL